MRVEETIGGIEECLPGFSWNEIGNLVGNHQLIDLNVTLRAQGIDQIDGLREWDVAIVVGMNEQNRRTPPIRRLRRTGNLHGKRSCHVMGLSI